MSMHVRLLPPLDADGPTQMAADEVLLEAASAGAAGLRFYTWAPPTLSLGYFQQAAARESDPRLSRLPFVRRVSGGGTLVHHHELTYGVALPKGGAWQPRGQSWICRMHAIIADALRQFDVAARLVECGEEQKLHDVLCFLHNTPGDLIVAGRKIAGSAQRKSRGALLQHGGILLRQSEHAPDLLGIEDLGGAAIPLDELQRAIVTAFHAATGWICVAQSWTAVESRRVEELAAEKYGAFGWNHRR